MVSPNLIAAVLTIGPAMGMLWFFLRRYEGYFEQSRLFFALILGLFAGTLVRALEVFFFPFDNPRLIQPDLLPLTTGTLVYSFAYTAFGLGVLETLGKTAVLGFKKFRTRKDTPYYGIALGLGFGAMWTIQFLAGPTGLVYDRDAGAMVVSQPALFLDFFAFLLAMGLLLAHGASAVWVGRGAGEGRLWHGAMFGTLWLAPGLAMYWLYLHAGDQVLPAVGALAWGGFAMWIASNRILETIVPPEIRDMVRKEMRRKARKEGRE